ncbi:MAG: hypothetical protein AB7I13_18945, partial [Vicinamibacterales bacterium]
MFRAILALLLVLAAAAGGLFVMAGRTAPPTIEFVHPEKTIGQTGTLEFIVGAPGTKLDALAATLEQNGKSIPLFSLDAPGAAALAQADADHLRVTRPLGKKAVPELESGPARIVVSARRSALFGLRTVTADAARDVQVRLEPPRVAVLSTHHYVNHGGAEMVVYRATPPDVESGVRVGDVEYTGYPASGAGLPGADASTRVAFFALLHDQDLNTPIVVFARDEAGNQATAPFVEKVFPKPFRKSRIEINDRFLTRVVPEILSHSPELGLPAPTGDLVGDFVKINSDLRRLNADRIL